MEKVVPVTLENAPEVSEMLASAFFTHPWHRVLKWTMEDCLSFCNTVVNFCAPKGLSYATYCDGKPVAAIILDDGWSQMPFEESLLPKAMPIISVFNKLRGSEAGFLKDKKWAHVFLLGADPHLRANGYARKCSVAAYQGLYEKGYSHYTTEVAAPESKHLAEALQGTVVVSADPREVHVDFGSCDLMGHLIIGRVEKYAEIRF